jgi:hypothetical protein
MNMKPGDMIAAAIKPIGYGVLGLDCYDNQGQLKPESGCAQRRDALNEAYDFFFSKLERKDKDNGRGQD